MLVSTTLPVARVLFVYLRAPLLLFTAAGGLAYVLIDTLGIEQLRLPTLPLTVVGVALSIFLGFRTNSAYDRYWEARKLWGALVNVSRHFAHQVLEYVEGDDSEAVAVLQEDIVTTHAAYVHALRSELRRGDALDDEHVRRLLTDAEVESYRGATNVPAAMLRRNRARVVEATHRGWLGEERLRAIDLSFAGILDVQGGCERILNTPIPISYVYFARRLVMWYGALLPFGMIAELGLLAVLIGPLVAMVFVLIDETGFLIQDPFTTGVYGLPLSSLSITIERNVREFVPTRPQLPPPVEPVGPHRELLM
jgi:putative membrane protein